MTTLILPVGGKSSRFPNMRPKWLLTMPCGKLMIEKSVEKLDLDDFDRIIVTCLESHLSEYVDSEKLLKSLRKNIDKKVEILSLEKSTSCQAETVYVTLIQKNVKGGFYIKDCDNVFSSKLNFKNSVSVVNLNEIDLIDAKNKSYVDVNERGEITNIVEKNVISNNFCCGGYYFESVNSFKESYENIISIGGCDEIYISHIIYEQITNGKIFEILTSNNYIDWGTKDEYQKYCNQYITIFCDVDGVLLENGSKFGKDGWASDAIKKNVKSLIEIQNKGFLYLIITTSRPSEEENYVRYKLKEIGLSVDMFISGLPHAKRLLINDFYSTNPYPSAISINLPRNSDELGYYIDHLTGK